MKTLLAIVVSAVAALAVAHPAMARVDAGAAAEMKAKPTLIVRSTQFGRILFDGRGQALYGFTRDRRGGPSRCYGECAKAWPVYYRKGPLTAGKGVKASLIGTTRRTDGRRQITYNGWPLYFYAHEGLGEVKCQNVFGFGGLWLVARPDGTLVR
jgi:predicted lipoprotein with Yx(FWY)xxD motif